MTLPFIFCISPSPNPSIQRYTSPPARGVAGNVFSTRNHGLVAHWPGRAHLLMGWAMLACSPLPGRDGGSFPHGQEVFPVGRISFPTGSGSAAHGNALVPCGSVIVPHGSVSATHGNDPFPYGKGSFPHGKMPFPCGSASSPHGTAAIPHGARSFPHGSAPFPLGHDGMAGSGWVSFPCALHVARGPPPPDLPSTLLVAGILAGRRSGGCIKPGRAKPWRVRPTFKH